MGAADITVITATIPERADMLAELAVSLAVQDVMPTWFVGIDHDRRGPAAVLNDLAANARTEWLFRCDDDDLFDADHFVTLAPHLTDDHDIVWTWPRVDPPGWIGEHGLQVVLPIKTLRDRNWIASAAAVRTSLWHDLGGLRDVPNEDHDFWIRALDAGARFHLVPQVTWTYRLGDWPHRSEVTT